MTLAAVSWPDFSAYRINIGDNINKIMVMIHGRDFRQLSLNAYQNQENTYMCITV